MANMANLPGNALSFELPAPSFERMVVLIRLIFHGGCPFDEAPKVRWIGLHFFFSFELSYQGESRSAVCRSLRGQVVR